MRPSGYLPSPEGPTRSSSSSSTAWVGNSSWTGRSIAPTLAAVASSDAGRAITSVAPTTTATALTSIATGRAPSEHGVLGYRVAVADDQVLNVLRWQVGSGRPRDARRTIPAATFQPFAPFPGSPTPVPVVSRVEFGGTGFTAVHLGDSPLHGYRVLSTMVVETRQLLAQGSPFIYGYYDGIDKVAHAHGLGEHYDAELRAVDELVAEIAASLPDGAVLVVTADHGQVDVGPQVVLPGKDLMSAVRFISGEGRFRWLHAQPGAAKDLLADADELYGETTWVRTRDQLLDDGWFGGPPPRRAWCRAWETSPSSPMPRLPSWTRPTRARPAWRPGTGRSRPPRCWSRSFVSPGVATSPHDHSQ